MSESDRQKADGQFVGGAILTLLVLIPLSLWFQHQEHERHVQQIRDLRREAVDRGFAEYDPSVKFNGHPVWKWKEPQ